MSKKASALLTRLKSRSDRYLRLLRFAPANKQSEYRALFARAQRIFKRAQNRLAVLREAQVYSGVNAVGVSKAATFLKSANSTKFTPTLPAREAEMLELPAPTHVNSFHSEAFRYLATQRRFTKNCMRLQAVRRRMIFDRSRPRL